MKCRITCRRVTHRKLDFLHWVTFNDFVGWAAHQTVFSVACKLDSETLAAGFQRVKTVVHTQRHRLDADEFPMISLGWTCEGFCSDLDPCLFE